MADGNFKDLTKRTASKNVLHNKFDFARHTKYNGYQRGLASVVYKFFDQKSTGTSIQTGT